MNRSDRRAAKKRADAKRDELRHNNGSTPAQPTVCVATLHGNGGITPSFADDWTNLLLHNGRHIAAVVSISGSLVAAARNGIVRKFLATGAEWLFTVDDDMQFAPDVLPRLLEKADPGNHPIVGALCFKVHRTGEVEPTLYQLETQPHQYLRTQTDWFEGELLQVAATGAACLLVHRSVFEKMPEPWFGVGELSGEELGEDVTFLLAAGQHGFPVHVATDVQVGHVKPKAFGLEDWDRQQAERAQIPTFVVVPVRDGSDVLPIEGTPTGVVGVCAIPNDARPWDGPGVNIPQKWNVGLAWARYRAQEAGIKKWNVLILNDDVVIDNAELVVGQLSEALRSDPAYELAYPNTHGFDGVGVVETRTDDPGGLTHSGWCFMVRGESARPFDERYPWWYSDNVYEKQIHADGRKVVSVLHCHPEHLRPNEATFANPAIEAQARKDEALFASEWGINPADLFFARRADLVRE